MPFLFEWDPIKAAANVRKHGVSFATAGLVFGDPFLLIEQDRIESGEYRWRATGRAGSVTIFVVAHTYPVDEEDVIRIISARPAGPMERRQYEQHVRSQQF